MLLSRYLKITFHILLVEREIIHRGGNAAYISGNHQSMYDSFLHRFNATLERPDVTYMGVRDERFVSNCFSWRIMFITARGHL